MSRRFSTKEPLEPHPLYLDEGISGSRLYALLRAARLIVFEYERLLPKNRRIQDEVVLKSAVDAGYILVSRDGHIEDDELDHLISSRARIILLEDKDGGPVSWAAALICAHKAYERVLLDNPVGPLTIHVTQEGKIRSTIGEAKLKERFQRLMTARISRRKRHRRLG